jgi:hypothetical protein
MLLLLMNGRDPTWAVASGRIEASFEAWRVAWIFPGRHLDLVAESNWFCVACDVKGLWVGSWAGGSILAFDARSKRRKRPVPGIFRGQEKEGQLQALGREDDKTRRRRG